MHRLPAADLHNEAYIAFHPSKWERDGAFYWKVKLIKALNFFTNN